MVKMGNQNPYRYIEEGQTTQWSKEKVQKAKQRSTKHTHKTKDRVTRTPLKSGGELRCSGRVSSSCSTSGTRRVSLVTNPVISRDDFNFTKRNPFAFFTVFIFFSFFFNNIILYCLTYLLTHHLRCPGKQKNNLRFPVLQ